MLGHDYITKPEVTRPYLTYFLSFPTLFLQKTISTKTKNQKPKIEFFKKIKDLN